MACPRFFARSDGKCARAAVPGQCPDTPRAELDRDARRAVNPFALDAPLRWRDRPPMTFTALIDTAIGLTLLYLGAALFVTVANESIAGMLKLRGRMLADNLRSLLGADVFTKQLLTSPLFQPMRHSADLIRSYVDPAVVAQVLVAWVTPKVSDPAPAAAAGQFNVGTAIQGLPDSQIKTVLWTLAQSAQNDVDKLKASLASWIDKSLTILGESYKRRVHVLSFGLGLVLAVAFNIDTVNVCKRLYGDKELRDAAALSAESIVAKTSGDTFDACTKLGLEGMKQDSKCTAVAGLATAVIKRDDTLGKLPIGWPDAATFRADANPFHDFSTWVPRLFGWLLTGLAVSMGAPFWFDLLSRFVNVRTTIPRPQAQPDADS
jgi:hypothetical protein